MKSGLNRILSRVRIHGGDSGVSARATHHNVEKDLLITYVSALSSQADLGNVSRSTTERKKMSTKTTFKRVALVTVAALGMGVLTSVAPASAAQAAAGASAWQITDTTGTLGTGSGTAGAGLVAQGKKLITAATTQATTSTKTGAAEATVGSYLTFTPATTDTMTAAGTQTITVTGPAVISSWLKANSNSTNGTNTLDATSKILKYTVGADTHALASVAINVTGTGTVTVTIAYSAPAESTVYTIAAIADADASAVGTMNVAKSNVAILAGTSGTPTTANTDATGSAIRLNAAKANVYALINDVYGKAIAGQLVATVTAGLGTVKIQAVGGDDSAGTTGLSSYTTDGTNAVEVVVAQKTANTAADVTFKLEFNGTLVATKTIKFYGDIAKLVATAPASGAVGKADASTANTGIVIAAYDAANNAITASGIASASTNAADVTVVASTTVSAQPVVISNTVTSATAGAATYVCADLGGTGSVKYSVTNAAGVVITSDAITLKCADGANDTDASVTAAFDKAKYSAGEIATLTLTFKDGDKNLVNGVDVISSETLTVTSSALTAVTAPTALDKAVAGVKTYKFIVGQTPGKFQAVVVVPGIATDALGKTTTLSVEVTSTASSEIAQLVKVIGTLLTTFTKQITALIKALKK